MSGRAGTPRFGVNPDEHDKGSHKAGPDGITRLRTPDGTDVTEVHYAYNPALRSRDVDEAPGRAYVVTERQAEYMCNHDGYAGGMAHNLELDERKVLDNTIFSVKVKFEADDQDISGTKGEFD